MPISAPGARAPPPAASSTPSARRSGRLRSATATCQPAPPAAAAVASVTGTSQSGFERRAELGDQRGADGFRAVSRSAISQLRVAGAVAPVLNPGPHAAGHDRPGGHGTSRCSPTRTSTGVSATTRAPARRRRRASSDVAGAAASSRARALTGIGTRARFSISQARSVAVGSRRWRCQPAAKWRRRGLDQARRQAQVDGAARLADPHVEHQHHDDLVRRGDLQHLRPRLARRGCRRLSPTIGRHVSASESSSTFTTESTTFCSMSVSARSSATGWPVAAEHAVDHREGDGGLISSAPSSSNGGIASA